MTAAAPDLSDFALWRNGFPDELFAELRRTRPLFHHELTPGVASTVRRDFWVTTKDPHVAFGGGGPHHCLGAMLARAELRAVFGPATVAHPNLLTNMSIYDEMAISLTERR